MNFGCSVIWSTDLAEVAWMEPELVTIHPPDPAAR